MASVLLTGMTAAQLSPKIHLLNQTFAGLMHTALESYGYQVDWMDPQVEWVKDDLTRYSAVFVGLAPITSLSANRAYGALNVIERLMNQRKIPLFLYLDAPEPARIWAGLRATMAHPENFTKPFFSYRKGYDQASVPGTRERLLSVVERLLHDDWPATIYPALPWHGDDRLHGQLPYKSRSSIIPVSLDRYVKLYDLHVDHRVTRWAVEPGNDRWLKSKQTTWEQTSLTDAAKSGGDVEVSRVMVNSSGVLIAPHRDGTWWSPRYQQAVDNQVPVVTEWRESQTIGEAWSYIINTVEGMRIDDQIDLADAQRMLYESWSYRRGELARALSLPTRRTRI